jgi:hypothetical protein
MNSKDLIRRRCVANLRYYVSTYFEGLRNTTMSMSLDRDRSPLFRKYDSDMNIQIHYSAHTAQDFGITALKQSVLNTGYMIFIENQA